MANIQENLNILSEIKTDIKTAIINKGVDAGDDITVYGDKIREISGDVDYFYLEAVEDGAVSFEFNFDFTGNLEYSFDKKSWIDWDFYEIALNAGQRVYFRGNNPQGFSENDGANLEHCNFVISFKTNIGGNIMTLVDYKGETNVLPSYCFYRFFSFQLGIYDCSNLKLPATIVSRNCYGHMFRSAGIVYSPKILPAKNLIAEQCYLQMFVNCSELLTAPELPATTLSEMCYQYMFDNCSSLTQAPALPATTLTAMCYKYMFDKCSKLIIAPYLPAKTLLTDCYNRMFLNCSSLQYIKAEFTTAPSTTYTNNWVSGVASTGCFIKAKDATWTTKSTHACPSGWTLITSVS